MLTLAAELAGYAGTDEEQAVDALLKTRAVARTEKNWELADSVRDGLSRLGVTVEDTAGGARVIYRQELRRDMDRVEGRNAVSETLSSGRRIESLYLLEGLRPGDPLDVHPDRGRGGWACGSSWCRVASWIG